ncbi:replication initiator [Nonomuraea wenchangensis]|uniref:replication initiator n=1 Tax=Nonomuraea wenchangensis TaxID=568860 RepID=UPI00343DA831
MPCGTSRARLPARTGCARACSPRAPKPEWLLAGAAPRPISRLGYAGRRVLVSRKWSNKTLAEHKQDRRTWVLEALGQADQPADPHRYVWRPVPAGDANVPPLAVRLLRSIDERQRWRNHMNQLQAQADGQDLSATEGRAA